MSTWGYILFGIGIGIVSLPVILWLGFKLFVWGLKKKLSSAFEELGKLGMYDTAPPLRVSLRPYSQDSVWEEVENAEQHQQDLEKLDFRKTGTFSIEELGDVYLSSYLSDCGTIAAYLYKHPVEPKAFLDFVRTFEDGTSVTVSDAEAQGLDNCPEHPNVKLTGSAAPALLAELKKQMPAKTPKELTADTLQEVYQDGYAAIMDWRVEKGGVSREEVLAQSEEELTEEKLDEAMVLFREQHLAQLQELLLLRYTESTELPVQKWEEYRDRLVFVHDRFSLEEVRAHFERAFYWLEPNFPHPNKGGREGFAQMIRHLPTDVEVKQLEMLQGSIEADVYLLPHVTDEYDD